MAEEKGGEEKDRDHRKMMRRRISVFLSLCLALRMHSLSTALHLPIWLKKKMYSRQEKGGGGTVDRIKKSRAVVRTSIQNDQIVSGGRYYSRAVMDFLEIAYLSEPRSMAHN